MQGFEPVALTWKGAEYTVPADGQLMLVARIESALRAATGKPAMQALLQSGGPDGAALAMAYGAALRHAGADVSDDELYLSIQEDFAESKAETALVLQEHILTVLSIISPPIGRAMQGGTGEKK